MTCPDPTMWWGLVAFEILVLLAYGLLNLWGQRLSRQMREYVEEIRKPVCWKCCAEHEDGEEVAHDEG